MKVRFFIFQGAYWRAPFKSCSAQSIFVSCRAGSPRLRSEPPPANKNELFAIARITLRPTARRFLVASLRRNDKVVRILWGFQRCHFVGVND